MAAVRNHDVTTTLYLKETLDQLSVKFVTFNYNQFGTKPKMCRVSKCRIFAKTLQNVGAPNVHGKSRSKVESNIEMMSSEI